jgi:hypothetical protein
VIELGRREVIASKSTVYRCLDRAGLIEPDASHRRKHWKRWERGAGSLVGHLTRPKANQQSDYPRRGIPPDRLAAAPRRRLLAQARPSLSAVIGNPCDHAGPVTWKVLLRQVNEFLDKTHSSEPGNLSS